MQLNLYLFFAGWETATRKGNFRRVLHVTPKDSRDVTPSDQHRVSIDPRIIAEKITEEVTGNSSDSGNENTENSTPVSVTREENNSVSLPASQKSTLKRNNRKKRSSLDSGENNKTSLSKPVLISDRDFDVASAIAAQRRYKSAFDVLDESKIKQMVNQGTHPNAGDRIGKPGGTFDTLYISDIGYGMCGGPISMGRFGLGKYMPPDRSNEILPLDPKTQESSTKTTTKVSDTIKDVTDDNANDEKNLIIKTGSSSPKYIRDAERFTELTTTPACPNAGSKIAQPDIIPKTMQQAASKTDLKKENPILAKSQEIDLD